MEIRFPAGVATVRRFAPKPHPLAEGNSALTGDGLDNLPRTRAALVQGMTEGLHVGAQVYVSLRGQPVADGVVGLARPGVPMTRDTLMLWMSATKPVAAVAIAQLWERGLLDLDDFVARHI